MRWAVLMFAIAGCGFEVAGTGPRDARVDAAADAAIDAAMIDACATCPANDVAGGAQPITGTTQLTVNLAMAHDDRASSCAVAGGRDLFFELVVPTAQVVYVDTIGTALDATLSISPGPCVSAAPEAACANDPCAGFKHAQLARSLAAGVHCLVLDEGAANATDTVILDVLFAGRDGAELTGTPPYTASGDTCDGLDVMDPQSCEFMAPAPGTAKDDMYWFTVCPGNHAISASTCGAVGYDSIVYLRSITQLACIDDGCGAGSGSSLDNIGVTGNGLMMVVVDGWNGECGTYTLTVDP